VWVQNGTEEHIAVITNIVDPELLEYRMEVVEEYSASTCPFFTIPMYIADDYRFEAVIPLKETAIPSDAGSDHASWYKAGYQSSMAFENGSTSSVRVRILLSSSVSSVQPH
jgi:hypothetical protein